MHPQFQSRFTARLPADPETSNERRQVFGACYSRVRPTPVSAPRTLAWSREVAAMLELTPEFCTSQTFAEVMAGNRTLDGMDPHAMCYGGHQFGNWAGQLGDGRAINLGELTNARGEHWTLQLKGAGETPYSRTADGRAVLRSSLREYLCSEAMHHLGVPTTRALSLVTTGDMVVRDMFYDGNARPEPGAVVCRVAPSFVRFGNFELLASRQEFDVERQLLDHVIETEFPELLDDGAAPGPATYVRFFAEVARRTADMIVHWMRVGFVHGVMNTDNMSILGLTIDYGPYGWLDDFDPEWTPNTTDAGGRRYRYGQQPQIGMWNLTQLGNALYPLVDELEPLQQVLSDYASRFQEGWYAMMAAKLGLDAFTGDGDKALFNEVLAILTLIETDMTLFWRSLAAVPIGRDDPDAWLAALAPAWYDPAAADDAVYRERLVAWLRAYAARVGEDGTADEERRARMNRVNPKYVLRNYLAQLAIDRAEQGDGALLDELHEVLRHPYDEQPEHEAHAALRPDWARDRAGCSMLSCSS
ncbi:MAG TPA: YdiU family protein [Pseudomonadales bacterium]|nr:YdiU family protein [Pseudomonadales bacterium]